MLPPAPTVLARSISERVERMQHIIESPLHSHGVLRSRSLNNLPLDRSNQVGAFIKDNHVFVKPPIQEPGMNSAPVLIDTFPDALSLTSAPSHTMPVTRTLLETPFETYLPFLREMGFSYDEAEVALVYTRCVSVEVAIDFLTRNPEAVFHAFTPLDLNLSGSGNSINSSEELVHEDVKCSICGLSRVFHLIDNHHKIIESSPVPQNEYMPRVNLQDILREDDSRFNEIVLKFAYDPVNESLSVDELISMANQAVEREQFRPIASSGMSPQARAVPIISPAIQKLMEELENQSVAKEVNADDQLCNICGDYASKEKFHSGSCGHDFCQECLREYYKVKISSLELEIHCADPECHRKIGEQEILDLIHGDADLIEKYNRFKIHVEAARNPNARWCPKAGCQTVLIGSAEKPKLTCGTCNTSICFNCNQLWHSGKCSDALDDQYAEWARDKDIQTCPQCRVRIEKNLGCNHMTCPVCRHQFCWLCRAEYTDNHFSPFNPFGCPGMQFALEEPDEFRPGPVLIWLLRLCAVPLVIALGALAIGLLTGGYFLFIGFYIALLPCFIAFFCYEGRSFCVSASFVFSWPCQLLCEEMFEDD